MDKEELFYLTQFRVGSFRALLSEKIGDRESNTAYAIDSCYGWAEIAAAAHCDLKDPDLSDLLYYELSDFAFSMEKSVEAWWGRSVSGFRLERRSWQGNQRIVRRRTTAFRRKPAG